jgi:hypothetical protein
LEGVKKREGENKAVRKREKEETEEREKGENVKQTQPRTG